MCNYFWLADSCLIWGVRRKEQLKLWGNNYISVSLTDSKRSSEVRLIESQSENCSRSWPFTLFFSCSLVPLVSDNSVYYSSTCPLNFCPCSISVLLSAPWTFSTFSLYASRTMKKFFLKKLSEGFTFSVIHVWSFIKPNMFSNIKQNTSTYIIKKNGGGKCSRRCVVV